MKIYVINEMNAYDYERFVVVEEIGKNIKITVHFLEYDEYLEVGEKSRKKKQGDILEGDLSIELVTFHQKTDKDLMHYQKIDKSSHIEAIIEVVQIVDTYSVYALSTLSDDNILVEFENVVNYKVGERVLVSGSLELLCATKDCKKAL